MSILTTKIESILRNLPDSPGIYKFLDTSGIIIYVGKAKSLKKRVNSYFSKEVHESGKVNVMVKKIADIHYTVVKTEFDAMLLENNLIKELQPKYNILLKDDKTFPWICIKNERFPRVFPTRNIIKDGSQYFGPYASGRLMHTLLDLIRHLYPLRNCNFNLSEENIKARKFKVCLEYHIHNCKGPCEGLQDEEDYNKTVSQIRNVIKGNISTVLKQMKSLMNEYSTSLDYEEAQIVKEKIDLLEKYQGKSTIVNPAISNVDVFSVITKENFGYVNYLKVIDGAIVSTHTVELKKKLDETDDEMLTYAITDLRQRFESDSKEIIIPFLPEITIPGISYTIPQKGDRKQLLELSERNARYFMLEKQKQKELTDPNRHGKKILEQLKADLHLKDLPEHIECFDNSNIQGAYPVSALVVFKNAKPDKKEYRHFNIKTVEGPNDFASMEEVIERRYKRLTDDNKPLPQLLIVDGGKGQLSSAVSALKKIGLYGKINIIGIAKRLEEIYSPNDSIPLYINKKSESLRLIQRMRDEAHRFGITHHRSKREKALTTSELTEISGVGEKTMQVLLHKFRSVNNIKKASADDLKKVVGKAKGEEIYKHFHPAEK